MAKRTPKRTKPDDGTEVLYLRIDHELSDWLGELSASTGRSRNQLAESVLEEFRDVIRLANRVEREGEVFYFVNAVGAGWASRLVNMGVVSETLRDAWRDWLTQSEAKATMFKEDSERMHREGSAASASSKDAS